MRILPRPIKRFIERTIGGVGVLMYHRVAEEAVDPWNLCVTPRHFDEQMSVLAAARAHVRLSDAARARDRLHPGVNRFAVTFDDGYVDNLVNALPVLERYEVPATIFVASGMVGAKREFWWDALERVILGAHALPPKLLLKIDGQERTFEVDSEASERRRALFQELWSCVFNMVPEKQHRVVDEIIAWSGCERTAPAGRLPVNAEELAQLAAHPLITIGSHTIDHVSLTDCAPENQRAQIDGGRRMLEEMIGAPVATFAYPYGRHDGITVGIVKALGLDLACTTHEGPATFRSDPHRLPRLMVVDQDGSSFANWLRRSHGLARPVLS